ncbi:MAG TPA: coproporphyrinogen III oxidase, partial [Chitinophagaceae bacterium]|nr:coproporphyrinogen III oxidase [Chitinophagaceae bacterium]
NVANNAVYIKSLQDGVIPAEKEVLTKVQRLNEYIMTSLRTMEGLDLSYAENYFGKEVSGRLITSARKFIDAGSMVHDKTSLRLTKAGKLLADGIAADLFF